MSQMATLLGTVPAGARIVAIGAFAEPSSVDLLIALPDGSYRIWTDLESGRARSLPVALPAGYRVLGSGAYDITIPGLSQLLLQNGAGDLAYGSYLADQATFSATTIGRPGSGWSVKGRADYNTWYHGNDQVLLQAVQNGIGTVWAYQSQLPSFTLPSGFAVVGTGNLFGTDLPATLISNAGGTLEAVMQGGMVTPKGVAPSVSITSIIGTLGAGDIVGGVSAIGNTGTAAILVQNGTLLSEWMVHQGVLAQTQVIGAVPSGATVSGFTDVNGDAVPDVLLMTNTGTVVALLGDGPAASTAATAKGGLLRASRPAIGVDSGYDVVTRAGVNAVLSDHVAQLAAGRLGGTGASILVIQQGALSQCSFEQVAAGNITFAAWQQNVATLNAIAQACREQGIIVEVETGLGLNADWGPAQTEQWLKPAIAAGLPIGLVEDDSETNLQSLNLAAAAGRVLQNIAIINAAYPDAEFGEWRYLGDISTNGALTPYQASLRNWWMTLNGSAAALGLPGLSYVVADQYYSPQLAGSTHTVSAAGKAPGQNITYNQFAAFMNVANASGIAVNIAASPSDGDLNALQALARQELLVSQEAPLGIAGVRLSPGFNALPASAFVNVAGSTYNSAAEIAAIEPLYHAGLITASGSIGLSLPSQIVLQQGVSIAPGGFSIDAAGSDSSNRIAVVLIDNAGTLSATQVGGATVTRHGPNILILNGTPADVTAELATLTLNEDVAGPDSIDVQVFGRSGRIGGGSVPILATSGSGGNVFLPSSAGASPPPWQSAGAEVVNGRIVSETFTWNISNGLAGSDVIGPTTIKPLMQIPVAQPLLERGLTASGTVAHLAPSILTWHAGWQAYEPLSANRNWASEIVPMTVATSTLAFDAATGRLAQQIDALAPLPAASIAGQFPFDPSITPFYFATGGLAVTNYALPNSPYWQPNLYANGAGGIVTVSGGSNLVIAAGSTTQMEVGSIQTIYGTANGSQKVIEVRYLGGPSNPYDEIDQIFNPYSATPQLWQQIQTVGIPQSMADGSPLPLPSATTVIEFNTGNNPNWSDTIWTQVNGAVVSTSVAGYRAVAKTVENNNWDSQVQISATGEVTAQRGVTWIGEGEILAGYTLAAPAITGWSAAAQSISGRGIAGDWVVVTGSNGQALGGTQVAGDGAWTLALSANLGLPANFEVSAQQFDLAGDSSARSASYIINDPARPVSAAFTIRDTTTGLTTVSSGAVYTGPVSGLEWECINITAANLNITSSVPNAFLRSGSGMDGLNVGLANGNNVLDGGTGSNFLTGGTGNDTFYLDGRNPASPIWSTIVNFHAGDDATIWGVNATDFQVTKLDDAGAPGYTGLDLIFSKAGQSPVSFTIAGYDSADMANGRLTQTWGKTQDLPGLPGSEFLTIHAN